MTDVTVAATAALRFYTLADVTEITRLSASTVRRQIRLKRLSVHRIGRLIRVSETDLQAFLGKRRTAAR